MVGSSAGIVRAWGDFLYRGVVDPLGRINSLWPLFGIANQLLAIIALCVGTTILVKLHQAKYLWITCTPLAWLVCVGEEAEQSSCVRRRLAAPDCGRRIPRLPLWI